MDGKGDATLLVERFWRTVKFEEVYLKAYESVAIVDRPSSRILRWPSSSLLA
jgi:hypothetical protein